MGEAEALGLFRAGDFALVRGRDAAIAGRAAAWYFAEETVAVPVGGGPVAGFTPGMRPMHDVRRWGESHALRAPLELPPLVWIAAPDTLRGARIDADASTVTAQGRTVALKLVPKLALNRSWFDEGSAAFFAPRKVALRGTLDDDAFEARTFWPEDFRFGPLPPPRRRLPEAATPGQALRMLMRETFRADAPFEAATLWERQPGSDWSGHPVLAFVVNGAQGDDDEAHAGHFAIATGRIASDGSIGQWLVHNFYALDAESEKGILAAPVPLDNYHGDLNAGQAWYRPSWLLVAVLDDERAAARVQSALGRVYLQFWRHQLAYYHPTDNCTSVSIDTLRALGFDVPLLGPTSRWAARLAFPALLLRERSLAQAKLGYDYLVTERTRLLPSAATEAVFDALWSIAQRRATQAGLLGREIAQDLAALALVRIPQFPSSRAWGGPPVVSLSEYRARMPADPAKRRIVPIPPRPFPESLRDPDLLPPLPHPSDLALRFWALAPLALLALGLIFVVR